VAAFVPLVDCAVLVAAREQGFAAEAASFEGIEFPSSDVPAYLRQFEMHTPFAVAHSP
jgi:hypothetical protein